MFQSVTLTCGIVHAQGIGPLGHAPVSIWHSSPVDPLSKLKQLCPGVRQGAWVCEDIVPAAVKAW